MSQAGERTHRLLARSDVLQDDEARDADHDAEKEGPGPFDAIVAQLYAMRAQIDALLVHVSAMDHVARATARSIAPPQKADRDTAPATFMQRHTSRREGE